MSANQKHQHGAAKHDHDLENLTSTVVGIDREMKHLESLIHDLHRYHEHLLSHHHHHASDQGKENKTPAPTARARQHAAGVGELHGVQN